MPEADPNSYVLIDRELVIVMRLPLADHRDDVWFRPSDLSACDGRLGSGRGG